MTGVAAREAPDVPIVSEEPLGVFLPEPALLLESLPERPAEGGIAPPCSEKGGWSGAARVPPPVDGTLPRRIVEGPGTTDLLPMSFFLAFFWRDVAGGSATRELVGALRLPSGRGGRDLLCAGSFTLSTNSSTVLGESDLEESVTEGPRAERVPTMDGQDIEERTRVKLIKSCESDEVNESGAMRFSSERAHKCKESCRGREAV
jgi:hypothetical protein